MKKFKKKRKNQGIINEEIEKSAQAQLQRGKLPSEYLITVANLRALLLTHGAVWALKPL